MYRLQRSSFGWLESFALSTLASCTLTKDFEPERWMSPQPVEEATGPLEPLPAASAPGGNIDRGQSEVKEDPEVSRTSEAPLAPDVPLAASDPSSAPANEPGDAATPCALDCCSGQGCTAGPTSGDDTGECNGGTCSRPVGAACETAQGCASGVCRSGLCQTPTCSDAVQNADEAGIDCGGSSCVPCPCSYGTPEVLGDPNYAGNSLYSPSLSPDGLTLYFGLFIQSALNETNEMIAFSTRPSQAEPFGLGNPLPATINAGIEGTPRLASDNLTLYFYSERAGGLGGRDIYRAQRSAPGAAFDLVTNLTEINSAGMDHLPWVSADGLSMYFASDRNGDLDIHRTTRASTRDPWRVPEPVAELNTTAIDNGMTLTSDQREILFASFRLGGSDFFRAVRAPGETTFRAPEYVAAISSAADDTDPALSPDGTELYFSSTRDGTDSRIWRVSRTCP